MELMENKKRFLQVYLIIALLFGILGVIDASLNFFGSYSPMYGLIIAGFAFVFFIYNLFVLVHFMQDKLEKITLVLPIYYLVSYFVFFMLGLILVITGVLGGMVLWGLNIIGLLASLFEIVFAGYLLRRFKLVWLFIVRYFFLKLF